MEQTDPHDADAGARFTTWLRDLITQRGYDLDRRGERARLTRESGIPTATLSRLLAGEGADIRTLTPLAQHLRVPLGLVLVKAGVLTDADLRAARTPRHDHPLTPAEAADELGIHDPRDRQIFEDTVKTLRGTSAKRRKNAN